MASVFAICFDSRSVASVKKKKIEKLEVIENFFSNNSSKSNEKKEEDQSEEKGLADDKINKPLLDESILKLIRIYCDTLADI